MDCCALHAEQPVIEARPNPTRIAISAEPVRESYEPPPGAVPILPPQQRNGGAHLGGDMFDQQYDLYADGKHMGQVTKPAFPPSLYPSLTVSVSLALSVWGWCVCWGGKGGGCLQGESVF
jgi:hypothetical protein